MTDGDQQSAQLNSLLEDEPKVSPPFAWQPITPRGIAAFGFSKYGRVLLVASIIAAILAALVCWFFYLTFFPALKKAVLKLPETGGIQSQQLSFPEDVGPVLVEDRILGVLVNLDREKGISLASDFHLILHGRDVQVCSLLGCLTVDYPNGWIIEVNRKEMVPGLEAWKPMIYGVLFLSVVACLLIVWHALATLYFLVPWTISYYSDRQLTFGGSWRLSLASQMPGAFLMGGGVILYGLGWVDLVRIVVLAVVHLLVNWVLLVLSVRTLPTVTSPVEVKKNPFVPPPSAQPEPEDESKTIPRVPKVFTPSRKNPFESPPAPPSSGLDS